MDLQQMESQKAEGWSYFTWVAKVPSTNSLNSGFNLLGQDGWELVSSSTTVKSMVNLTGNDLIFIFKKPGAGHQVPSVISNRLGKLGVKLEVGNASAEVVNDGTW
jgi:hypothetical protein